MARILKDLKAIKEIICEEDYIEDIELFDIDTKFIYEFKENCIYVVDNRIQILFFEQFCSFAVFYVN